MKYLIASDLHGSAECVGRLAAAYEREAAAATPRSTRWCWTSPHSYMSLEDGVSLWKTLEGEVYRELDLNGED